MLTICVCVFVCRAVVHSSRGHQVRREEETVSEGTVCQTQGKASGNHLLVYSWLAWYVATYIGPILEF